MNKQLVLMILLYSTMGNVVGCDNEGELPDFNAPYKILRLGLWLSSKPDPSRPFGWIEYWKTWGKLHLDFKNLDNYLHMFSSIAENSSTDLEQYRVFIYTMSNCINVRKRSKARIGFLKIAIKCKRQDLFKLLTNNYGKELFYRHNGMRVLECFIENEDKYNEDKGVLKGMVDLSIDGGARLSYTKKTGRSTCELVKSKYYTKKDGIVIKSLNKDRSHAKP